MNHHSRPRKILVVDDDPIIRDMMTDMLEFEGYTITAARSGREALALLHSGDDYIVFLDVMMPGLSGADVCAQLEAEPEVRRRHIIVLMSAMDKLEEAASCKADAILPKPFLVDDLLQVLEPYMK